MENLVEIKEILRTSTSWGGTPLPGLGSGITEFKVLTFRIAPKGRTTIHIHPLNGAGYMIAGELTLFSTEDAHGSFENPKKIKSIKLTVGSAWAESVNIWHYGENQGHVHTEFVLIFAGQTNTPPTLSLNTHRS